MEVISIQPYMHVNLHRQPLSTYSLHSSPHFTRKIFSTRADHISNVVIRYQQQSIRGFHRKSYSPFYSHKACWHGHTLTATAENPQRGKTCADGDHSDLGIDENQAHQVEVNKNGLRWTDVEVQNVDAVQRKLIEELSPKMSGRSKAVLKHIICMTEEDDPYELLMKWVKIMKPKRVDWLAVLKHMTAYDHPLFFKITEIVLSEESFEANIRDYTKLIDAYANKGHIEAAERILGTMEERGFMCDAITFTVLIRMYSKAGKFDQARHIFDKMGLFSSQLDQKAYGAMIMAYVRAGIPEAGESLIREMEAKDINAGTEVYKALLKSFAWQGNTDGAQRVFNAMQFAGILPNRHTCTVLVEAYARAGDPDQARIAFENMIKAGHKPDDKSASIMVYAYEKKNLLGKALTFLLHLEKNGFKLGADTSACLIDWLGKLGFVEEAEQIFLEITEIGDVPSKVLVSLCDMYARAGLLEKAVNTLDSMQNNFQALAVDEFERLIYGLLAGGLVDQAKKMHDQMRIHGLTPSESISLALISHS